MASLNSLSSELIDGLNKPFDFMLKQRMIDSIISCRATLIRQEYSRNKFLPAFAIREWIEPLIRTIEEGRVTVVTQKIPKLIFIKDLAPLSFVGTSNRKQSFSYILPDEIELFRYNKISKDLGRYTYINGKLILFNAGNLDEVACRAPIADPRQLIAYNTDEFNCFTADDEDFIEEHYIPVIKDLVYKDLKINTEEHSIKVNGQQ